MRKTLLRAAAVLALVASLSAQSADPPPFDVSRLRAEFPDDRLPRLVADVQTAKGRRAARSLARLGVAAHEVLFGTLRGSGAALPARFADAFADLGASAGWAVPLLVDCVRSQSPASAMAIELLARFDGVPAGTLAAGAPAPDRPAACPPEWTAPLLELLEKKRSNVTWPALQALLRIGDDAAFEAALVLVQQVEVRSRAAMARRLLDVVHATYRARYGPDPSGPFQAPREVREAAIRGFVLADHHPQANFWWDDELRNGSAARRRTLALAAALGSPLGNRDPFVQFVLARPEEIPPLDVRPQTDPMPGVALRPPGPDQRLDSGQLIELLQNLDSGKPQERMLARSRLLQAEVGELSARAVAAVLAARERHDLDGFVHRSLHKAGPAAVRPVLEAIGSGADPRDRGTLLAVLPRIRPMEAATLRYLWRPCTPTGTTRAGSAGGCTAATPRSPAVPWRCSRTRTRATTSCPGSTC